MIKIILTINQTCRAVWTSV